MARRSPFEVLGIRTDAEIEVVRASYRALAKKYHPDVNPGVSRETLNERMAELNWAFDELDRDLGGWRKRARTASARTAASAAPEGSVDRRDQPEKSVQKRSPTSRSRPVPHFLRGRWFLAAIAVVVVPLVVVIAIVLGSGESDAPEVPPTPDASADRVAATAVVRRFIDAVGAGDVDALYAMQEESYKLVCPRERFAAEAAPPRQQLVASGDASVSGDQATALVAVTLPDGTTSAATVRLQRARDGTWRIAAPATSGCRPS